MERIVVGVDGSIAALRWAVREAALRGALVEAISAFHVGDGAIGWNDSLARRERDGSIDGGSGGELDPDW